MIVRLSQTLRERRDLPNGLGLVHKTIESVFARRPAAAHFRLHCTECRRELGEAGTREAVLTVETVLEHSSVGQPDHATSTVRPS